MEQSVDNEDNDNESPPEKRLEAPNYRLIEAGIVTIPDMETPGVRCVRERTPEPDADSASAPVESRRVV